MFSGYPYSWAMLSQAHNTCKCKLYMCIMCVITLCTYARSRVKCLVPSVCIFIIYVYVCMCDQKNVCFVPCRSVKWLLLRFICRLANMPSIASKASIEHQIVAYACVIVESHCHCQYTPSNSNGIGAATHLLTWVP